MKQLKKLKAKMKLLYLFLIPILTNCTIGTNDSFCLLYTPLLPSINDTKETIQHLNIYYELYEMECK